MKQYSRDEYEREFTRLNASWGYENNALTDKEKESVYKQLNGVAAAPVFNNGHINGGNEMTSKYSYPGTNILINHFGIKDEQLLQQAERYHTAYRAMELRLNPQQQDFNLDHLKNIHHHLFQDVYPFSGQLRTVNIGKNNYWFCDVNMMNRLSDMVFTELKDDKYLKGLSKDAFAEKAAYYYTEINYLHPFREGNGRTIREFFGQLSKQAGYELDWQKVPKDEYFYAVKMTDDPKQLKDLIDVFRKCLSPIENNQAEQWVQLDREIKLKDVLKTVEGLPAAQFKIDAEMLNKTVKSYNKGNNSIHLRFTDQTLTKIPLEKHPHLSQARKNQIIDRAAAADATVQSVQLKKYLEPGQ